MAEGDRDPARKAVRRPPGPLLLLQTLLSRECVVEPRSQAHPQDLPLAGRGEELAHRCAARASLRDAPGGLAADRPGGSRRMARRSPQGHRQGPLGRPVQAVNDPHLSGEARRLRPAGAGRLQAHRASPPARSRTLADELLAAVASRPRASATRSTRCEPSIGGRWLAKRSASTRPSGASCPPRGGARPDRYPGEGAALVAALPAVRAGGRGRPPSTRGFGVVSCRRSGSASTSAPEDPSRALVGSVRGPVDPKSDAAADRAAARGAARLPGRAPAATGRRGEELVFGRRHGCVRALDRDDRAAGVGGRGSGADTLHEPTHLRLAADRRGENPKAVQEFMGHSTIAMTFVATGTCPGARDEVRERMDAYLEAEMAPHGTTAGQ